MIAVGTMSDGLVRVWTLICLDLALQEKVEQEVGKPERLRVFEMSGTL